MSEPRTRFEVGPRDAGKRLDRFLNERIPGLSRNRIQGMIRERVEVSWSASVKPSMPVIPGGEVRIRLRPSDEVQREVRFTVLARGAGWLAIDKPAGLVVHPAGRVVLNSVIRLARRQEGCEALRLVHRLDRETSGVLILASDSPTARELSRQFFDHRVVKEYLALVRGVVEGEQGTIDQPIGPAPGSRVHVRLATGDGKPSRTDWQTVSRGADRTLLRLFPHSGRRHQLRVHVDALGHPILGDPLYGRSDADYLAWAAGDAAARGPLDGPQRQLLHCARVVFREPAAPGDEVEVTAPLPDDFTVWLPDGAHRAVQR